MRTIIRRATMAGMLAGTAALLSPQSASASLISIGECVGSCGSITTMGTDNGSGYATAAGSIGTFTLTSANATGSPLLPQPNLDTASIDVSSSGAGILEMFVTEQGLTAPLGVNPFLTTFTFNAFNGAGITSVTEESFISAANAVYTGTMLASATDTSGGLQTSSATVSSPLLTGPYSETVEYIIKASGAGSTNDTVDLSATPVPEPASLWAFAAGLGVLSLLMRSRRVA